MADEGVQLAVLGHAHGERHLFQITDAGGPHGLIFG